MQNYKSYTEQWSDPSFGVAWLQHERCFLCSISILILRLVWIWGALRKDMVVHEVAQSMGPGWCDTILLCNACLAAFNSPEKRVLAMCQESEVQQIFWPKAFFQKSESAFQDLQKKCWWNSVWIDGEKPFWNELCYAYRRSCYGTKERWIAVALFVCCLRSASFLSFIIGLCLHVWFCFVVFVSGWWTWKQCASI